MISTDIAWPVVLSCWCSTYQQCGQGISVSAVDWQQLPTARIWDQSNCFPLPVLACSPCRGLRSIAVHNSVACSTFALPSPSLMPGRLARAVATVTSVAVATAAGELACQRLRAYLASSLASAFSPSPPPASRRRRRLVTGPRLHYHHWQQSRPRVHVVVGAHGYQPRILGMWAKIGGVWANNGGVWAKNGGESCSP